MINKDVASILFEIAKIKETKGDNKFAIGAYRKAAYFIANLPTPVNEMDLDNTKGIGPKIANHINEYLATGKVQFIEENLQCLQTNQHLEELMRIEGIGEKTAQKIHEILKISTITELQKCIDDGSISKVLKEKSIENVKKGLEYLALTKGRIRLDQALELAMQIYHHLKDHANRIEFCGSLRRSKDTVGDVDIAVQASSSILTKFTNLPFISKVIDIGDKKASVWVDGVRVDCYVFAEKDFETGVMHLTGSALHNQKLRAIAKSREMTLSQYGLWRDDERLDNGSEKDVYNILGFEWIPPEHREGTIEFEKYVLKSRIELIEENDIEYDFHVHSTWSDGKSSIEDLIKQALKLEIKGFAVTDHSQSLKIAKGLTLERIQQKHAEIKKLRLQYPNIKILTGSEVDIKSDGSLDYPDEVLEMFDIVIASIHTNTKQDVTEIYKKVIQSGKAHILGHLTGRLINERPPHTLNVEAVLQECKKYNVAVEFNCQPNRLDVDENIMKRCKELGVKIAFGSDAHEKNQMIYLKSFGSWIGRRAWLTKNDIFKIGDEND